MSEDRPQYQAAMTPPEPPPTNQEIADMLRALSSDMMHLGSVMQYVGGFGKVAKLGTAMHVGASNLRTWAHEIDDDDDSDDQPKPVGSYIEQIVNVCTLSVMNGFPRVTITTDGKLPRSFPRCELLSVNPQGAHNYSADPVKVLGWIHRQTMRGGEAMTRTKRPEIVTTPPLMVARECAAAALGISEGTLEALVRRGELPKPRKISAARVGWLWRELQEFAEGLPVSELPPGPGRPASRDAAPGA